MAAADDIKSSAQVWGGQQELHIDESPPAYEGSNLSIPQSTPAPNPPTRPQRKSIAREPYHPILSITKWAKIPWGRYVVPEAVVSADRTTITTTSTTFLSSHQALCKLISEQSELPPTPTLHLTGTHSSHTIGTKVDFDITINLSGLLNTTLPPRWHNRPAQVVPLPNASGRSIATNQTTGSNTPQIESLTRQFLRDKSDRKSLVLTRSVDNLPTDVIEGLIRNMVASLHYRGKVHVTFPLQCGELVVQKRPAGTGAAVGGWFMNVLGLSPDVKYETLERLWSVGSPSEGEVEDRQAEASALIREWWNCWAPVIRDAVLLQRQGKVGVEDWMETQMGWRPRAKTADWGTDFSS